MPSRFPLYCTIENLYFYVIKERFKIIHNKKETGSRSFQFTNEAINYTDTCNQSIQYPISKILE